VLRKKLFVFLERINFLNVSEYFLHLNKQFFSKKGGFGFFFCKIIIHFSFLAFSRNQTKFQANIFESVKFSINEVKAKQLILFVGDCPTTLNQYYLGQKIIYLKVTILTYKIQHRMLESPFAFSWIMISGNSIESRRHFLWSHKKKECSILVETKKNIGNFFEQKVFFKVFEVYVF